MNYNIRFEFSHKISVKWNLLSLPRPGQAEIHNDGAGTNARFEYTGKQFVKCDFPTFYKESPRIAIRVSRGFF